jgi:hypothetical protein
MQVKPLQGRRWPGLNPYVLACQAANRPASSQHGSRAVSNQDREGLGRTCSAMAGGGLSQRIGRMVTQPAAGSAAQFDLNQMSC